MSTEQNNLGHKPQPRKLKVFHVDGAGSRPDGTGSGFAWVKIGTDRQRIERQDGLTCNQAEYMALIAALEYVADHSRVLIHSDSQLIVNQFNYVFAVRDPMLARLLSKARDLASGKELALKVKWIPREQNLAGKLLERC